MGLKDAWFYCGGSGNAIVPPKLSMSSAWSRSSAPSILNGLAERRSATVGVAKYIFMTEAKKNLTTIHICNGCEEWFDHPAEHRPDCGRGFRRAFECPECGSVHPTAAAALEHCAGLIDIRRVYRVKLYPKPAMAQKLNEWFVLCAELYNAALQERIEAWDRTGGLVRSGSKQDGTFRMLPKHAWTTAAGTRTSVNYASQSRQLPALKEARPEFADINSHVLQDVLARLDKAMAAFYKRPQTGFPRFQRADRFSSFMIPNTRYTIEGKWLTISRLGKIKFRSDREITGTVKSLTINRDGVDTQRWYASIIVEQRVKPLPTAEREIGISLGLKKFAVLSDPFEKHRNGSLRINKGVVHNPQPLQSELARIRELSQRVSALKQGSRRWKRAVQSLRSAHQKIARRREHFQHMLSKYLVDNYQSIAVENVSVKQVIDALHGKREHRKQYDAAWAMFRDKLAYKSEAAGRELRTVTPLDIGSVHPDEMPSPDAYIARQRLAARNAVQRAGGDKK